MLGSVQGPVGMLFVISGFGSHFAISVFFASSLKGTQQTGFRHDNGHIYTMLHEVCYIAVMCIDEGSSSNCTSVAVPFPSRARVSSF